MLNVTHATLDEATGHQAAAPIGIGWLLADAVLGSGCFNSDENDGNDLTVRWVESERCRKR